jgi:hypothetical protein
MGEFHTDIIDNQSGVNDINASAYKYIFAPYYRTVTRNEYKKQNEGSSSINSTEKVMCSLALVLFFSSRPFRHDPCASSNYGGALSNDGSASCHAGSALRNEGSASRNAGSALSNAGSA